MKKKLRTAFSALLLIVGHQIHAQELKIVADTLTTEQILELDLESLLNITVISASKKEEKILHAPSNITVITSDMIKE